MMGGKTKNWRWLLEAGGMILALLVADGCRRFQDEPEPNGHGYDYPAGFTFIEVPRPLEADNPRCIEPVLPFPGIGIPFRDSCGSTRLRRVTEVDGIQGRHEYSRFDPFNCSKTLIVLLRNSGDYAVYKTSAFPYNQSANFVCQTRALEDPRWDNENPDLLWGISEFKIVRDHVISGERTVIKNFAVDPLIAPILANEPDLYTITMRQEGEASADRRYWAFILQGTAEDYRPRYLFCWDRTSDKVLGIYSIKHEESIIDWVGMSFNGNWVLIGGLSENGGKLKGMTIANRDLTRFQRIDYTTAHADTGLDTRGREILDTLPPQARLMILVGRPYNAFDPGMNLNLHRKLKQLGVLAMPMDFLPMDEVEDLEELVAVVP